MSKPRHTPDDRGHPRRTLAAASCIPALLLALLAGCGSSGTDGDAAAIDGSKAPDVPALQLDLALGWDPRLPFARPLEHAPVFASVKMRDEPFVGKLRVTAPLPGPEGIREIVHELPVDVPAGGQKRYELPILIGAEPENVDVELIDDGGRAVVADILAPVLARPDDVLVAVFSDRRRSHSMMGDQSGRRHLYPLPSWVPRNPAAMRALDAIVIDMRDLPDLEDAGRLAALERYVRDGGHLIVATGPLGPPVRTDAFAALLPAAPAGRLGRYDVRPWLAEHFPTALPVGRGEDEGEGGDAKDGEGEGGGDAKKKDDGDEKKEDEGEEEDGGDEKKDGDDEKKDGDDAPAEVRVEQGILTAWPLAPRIPDAVVLFEGVRVPEPKARGESEDEDGEDGEEAPPEPPSDPDVGKTHVLGYTGRLGRGHVTVLGFSLLDAGAETLVGDAALTARLLNRRLESPLARHAPRQVTARRNPFAAVPRVRLVEDDVVRDMSMHLKQTTLFSVPPKHVVAAFLIVYILTLVPGLVLLFRAGRRTEWFWAAVPLVAAAFVFAAWRMSESTAGSNVALTAVEMVDVDSGAEVGASRAVISLYSPTGRAYDLQLPRRARPISPRVTRIRGTEAPPLAVDEASLNDEAGPVVRTFAVLAKDSRLIEVDGEAEVDGPLHVEVSYRLRAKRRRGEPAGGSFDGELRNEGGVDYESIYVSFNGQLVSLGALPARTTAAIPPGRREPTGLVARRLGASARAAAEATAGGPPVQERGEDAAVGRAREALRHVRDQAIASLLERIEQERLDRTEPIAILATPAPAPGVAVDGTEVKTVGWRIVVLHGEAVPAAGTRILDVKTRATARPRRSPSFVNDGGILDFADGMVDVEIEAFHAPERFVITGYRIELDVSSGASHDLPVIFELGPNRTWTQLGGARRASGASRIRYGVFEVDSVHTPARFVRLRLAALTDATTYTQHRIAHIQPILERR